MSPSGRTFCLCIAAAVLAACARSGVESALPYSGTFAGSNALVPAASTSGVRIVVTIPSNGSTVGVHAVPRYVSASTRSIAVAVTPKGGGTTKHFNANLTPSTNKACKGAPVVCSYVVALAPGAYTASFATYSGPLRNKKPTGNKLSANQKVAFKIKKGKIVKLNVTLGGIAASFVVTPLDGVQMTGSLTSGFSIIGTQPQQFTLTVDDAAGNTIIGPGAPTAIVASTPAGTTLGTPAPGSSNMWTLTSNFTTSTDPTVPQNVTLALSATPVPNSRATALNSSVPLALYQPWIYVVQNNNTISTFDEAGNVKLHAGSYPGISSPFFITYSPTSKLFYVSNCYNANHSGAITTYDAVGNSKPAGAASPFTNLGCPGQLAIDESGQRIYVGDYYSSAITEYDLSGTQQSVSGFGGANEPIAALYDPNNVWPYVASYNTSKMQVFTRSGSIVPGSSSWPWTNLSHPIAMALDLNNDLIYVANQSGTGSTGITVYDEEGNQHTTTGTWTGVNGPEGVAWDPYNGAIYASNYNNSTVTKYDEHGVAQTLSGGAFTLSNQPSGITVVP